MRLLAIDPGDTHSAYVVLDATTCRPLRFDKVDNVHLHGMILFGEFADCDHTAIEMIASYGMPVGAEVFETCVWIGRFTELALANTCGPVGPGGSVDRVKRLPVKTHHCHDSKAKDSNVTQALVDRFAPGVRNRGKGSKADPGWFYGFAGDVWQAYALGVYVADTIPTLTPLQTSSRSEAPRPHAGEHPTTPETRELAAPPPRLALDLDDPPTLDLGQHPHPQPIGGTA